MASPSPSTTMVDKDSFESHNKRSSQKPLTSSDEQLSTIIHSLCHSSLDDLHNPCPTLQEKEAIVTEADDPQVAVTSVSNWLGNICRQSGWSNICSDGDINIKAMVDLCIRVLKGTNTPQPSDSDTSSVVKEILNMQSRVQALNDVRTEAGDQWSIVLCDLLKRCTMEEQESTGSSEGEEFLDTPLSSSAPGTSEENQKTQECNAKDETWSQLFLSDRVVPDSLVAGENRDDERSQQEEISFLQSPLTCPDSEARLSNGSRSERFLSDLNVKGRGLSRSQDYITIPISKADWDSLSTFSVAFDSVDDYNVQSTHSGSQSLAFQEVDCHPSTNMLVDDDIFNTPNLEIETDWPTIPEIEDCAYEEILRERESLSAQPTFVSEFVNMPQDMSWSTDFASVTVCSETEVRITYMGMQAFVDSRPDP